MCEVKVRLELLESNIEDTFSLKNNKTLRQTLNSKRYASLGKKMGQISNADLERPLGQYLKSLKDRGCESYKLFLNEWGDLNYCRFKIVGEEVGSLKGLYKFVNDQKVVYIGRCHDSFKERFNNGYGNISPKNCYKDGQSTNCRINSLINSQFIKTELFLIPMNSDTDIDNYEQFLIKEQQPIWNKKI